VNDTTGNVGIGTIAPSAKLVVNGSAVIGDAGTSSATGTNAVAMGYGTNASGLYSIAMGYLTTASGLRSTAMGQETTASGNYSTASGIYSVASGVASIAMGGSALASGTSSVAMGTGTTASGGYSIAMGRSATASYDYSVAVGLTGDTCTANKTGQFKVCGPNGTVTFPGRMAFVGYYYNTTGLNITIPSSVLAPFVGEKLSLIATVVINEGEDVGVCANLSWSGAASGSSYPLPCATSGTGNQIVELVVTTVTGTISSGNLMTLMSTPGGTGSTYTLLAFAIA
jgi:hypothetical protein